MKKIALITFMGMALLSGCATSPRDKSAPQVEASTASAQQPAPVQQSVPVPAASAKKLVLNLSGTKTSTEARDWSKFKEEWRATFADHAKEAGITFSMQDGEPRPTNDAGTLLSVYVNDYRMVGIGSRIFFGAMTGNAYIDAKLVYNDLSTGKPFGEKSFNTTSSAWHGVFGKMTPQQVDNIAEDVFRELKVAK